MDTKREMHRCYYAIIPASVRYDKNIVPNAKLLYGEITALCNERGYCWAGNNYFAELYNVSKNTVSSWISSLVKNNYIEVDLIYKENSKEIQSRHIRIIDAYPIPKKMHTPTEKDAYPIHEIMYDNTQIINNKLEYSSKDETPKQKPIIETNNRKTKKTKDIVTMRSMINAFTQNEDIREKLLEYFNIRLKKGLQPNQWKIILDDLRAYAGDNASITVDKINGAIAGGYMQIIAAWEKDKKNNFSKPKFDNTAGRKTKAVVNMTEEEKEEFEQSLAVDEDGNPLKF
jgi:hypothetical protein